MKEDKLIKAAKELNQKMKDFNIDFQINIKNTPNKLQILIKRAVLLVFFVKGGLSEETRETINAITYPIDYVFECLKVGLNQIGTHLGFTLIPPKEDDHPVFKSTFHRDLTESELKSVNDLAEKLWLKVEHISANEVNFCIRNSF